MSGNHQSIVSAAVALANDLNSVLTSVRITGVTDSTRWVAAAAFTSVARQDVENVHLMIPSLIQAQQLNEDQTQELRDIVAWHLISTSVIEKQTIWHGNVIMRSQSAPLVKRCVRMALGTGDRHGLNAWLVRLPVEAREKDEWYYWQTDLLLERGRDEEAQAIPRPLMQWRGSYPMVATQRLGEEYTFRVDKALGTIDPTLASDPEMAWVCELMYWSIDNTARTEWANPVTNRTKSQQAQLARYAFDQHWWDLSMQVVIAGRLWDQLEERFPLAYNNLFACYISGKDIPQNCMMAVARQESARGPKVRSPIGTSGLMQTMPGTVTHTVSMFSIPSYGGLSQLLDPETNINIGTSYLQYVYQQFGNNHTYAPTTYSAGPGRARTWRRNSAGWTNTVAFVESIPFSETRGYMKSVLSYDAYYRYFVGQRGRLLNDAEWWQCY